MSKKLKIFCIIPARGGSKRIKNKNIKKFNGKPIIAYSIEAAHKSNCFDKIIVSTDNLNIARVSKKYSAEVPFLRPKSLSGDHTPLTPVIAHTIEKLKSLKNEPDIICVITATAPFINPQNIKEGLKILKKNKCEFVVSVTSFAYPIQRALSLDKKGYIYMLNNLNHNKRSQDLNECYHDAGQFYWEKVIHLKKIQKYY